VQMSFCIHSMDGLSQYGLRSQLPKCRLRLHCDGRMAYDVSWLCGTVHADMG